MCPSIHVDMLPSNGNVFVHLHLLVQLSPLMIDLITRRCNEYMFVKIPHINQIMHLTFSNDINHISYIDFHYSQQIDCHKRTKTLILVLDYEGVLEIITLNLEQSHMWIRPIILTQNLKTLNI